MHRLLAQFLIDHKQAILERWLAVVVERLGLESGRTPELIDDLPTMLDEMAQAALLEASDWSPADGARAHGRHRITLGIDIGGLAEELILIGEIVLDLARAVGQRLPADDVAKLFRMLGRATAASVREYGRLRDQQVAVEAAKHSSFLAHEIRTPLQTAKLAVALLEGAEGDFTKHLQKLKRAHGELTDLIDHSLIQSRLLGEPTLDVQRFSIEEVVADALSRLELTAQRKRIQLRAEHESFEMEADRKLVLSALANLLTNAVKFTHAGGNVILRARRSDDRVLFEVEDECGGIPEALLPRLFDPFVQGGEDRSGAGLGLAIVKQAIEAHRGAVRVINDPGRGCRFVAELSVRVAATV